MALPALREELALHDGPRLADGQPSWTLYDPVRNLYFQIDWLTFEILSRWRLASGGAIVQSINAETTLRASADDIELVAKFLVENQLLQPTAQDSAASFAERLRVMRGSTVKRLLHNYLFFRVPLVKPDAWLTRWQPRAEGFFTRGFMRLTLAALIVGLILVYRDFERFSATFVDLFSWQGLVGYAIALTGVKVLHELGHAFAAKRYGCRIPAMGVAFLVLWPVAYTDTNDVWKLTDKKQRLAVASAGVAAELMVAAWATLAWALLPDGVPRTVAFLLATTTWIVTIAINVSPFMRFDGYFWLSDWLEMPNLHSRAFALARWWLRERLFDLGEPPPEYFPRKRQTGLILFAYATWIYRLALFLGIAVLVYHFFIKAVGILLFVVEIGWFVVLPVWRELEAWRERWPVIRARPRTRRSAQFVLIALALLVVPWPTRVAGSAMLRPAQIYPVYAPEGVQVVGLPVSEGAKVKAGEPMIELASPDLELRWRKAHAAVASLQRQTASAGVSEMHKRDLPVLLEELAMAQAELANIESVLHKYVPRAPFDGELRDLDPELKRGVWVGRDERLAVLVAPGKWRVETYLDEQAVRRVRVGDRARFYAAGASPISFTVDAIDRDATRVLDSGMLAAPAGGSVAVRQKNGQWIPEAAVYRVTLTGAGDVNELAGRSWRGNIVIHGAWEAPAARFLSTALALFWREAGF
jgi:putative peptide zinc metalloprotease protein